MWQQIIRVDQREAVESLSAWEYFKEKVDTTLLHMSFEIQAGRNG